MGVVEQMDALFFDEDVNLNGKSILEIGSKVINYDLKKKLSERFYKFYFHGIDCIGGYGVDEIADICNMDCSGRKYDAIFSITVFEHVVDWQQAINNMKTMLRVGGYVFIVVPSVWPVHMFPIDCWRYSRENLIKIFADFNIEKMETTIQTPGTEECIFCRAKKLTEKKTRLSQIELERAK